MENIIGKPLYPSASGGAVGSSPLKPTNPPIREDTRPIQPIPGGEERLPNSADEPLVRRKIVTPPIPGEQTDLEANLNFGFEH